MSAQALGLKPGDTLAASILSEALERRFTQGFDTAMGSLANASLGPHAVAHTDSIMSAADSSISLGGGGGGGSQSYK